MTSNAEKLRVLLEDLAAHQAQQHPMTDSSAPAPMTYHSRTVGEEAFARGRYTEETRAPVVGAGARYPAAGGPWSKSLMRLSGQSLRPARTSTGQSRPGKFSKLR